MRSQFIIAFNEIVRDKQLPSETVFEALKAALVSAYRRNTNVSNSQHVEADIDARTGELTIYAEKEVVEDVFDDRTEVQLDEALRAHPDAKLGDTVMVDSTPAQFGRIAAQTAKQVILQRVREAERDHLYEEFSDREGEIVNGTVQSVTGGNITIGLGRTEAVLPRAQQVRGERYRPHDKIRVYVLEVKKGNRGPMIYVSRSHRNLLRRLLELEVPEIYNGHVDIKSIAREAGQRSKVAVQALQPGVDPVGACVGMRGVRIQSIVRELNDEKIDVIEWDDDPKNFIAKALSPARVSHVFLDDDPSGTRTASVIVPDDQLSLAIGREGQNARLAAKLTGWRIDIKSLTEAASDSLNLIDHPAASQRIVEDERLVEMVTAIVEKKRANRPIIAEDYTTLSRFIIGVEGAIIADRQRSYDAIRDHQRRARQRIARPYWELELEELNLKHRIHLVLIGEGIDTVGELMFRLDLGDRELLRYEMIDGETLAEIKARLEAYLASDEAPVLEEEDQVDDEIIDALEAERAAESAALADAVAAEAESFQSMLDELGEDFEDLEDELQHAVAEAQSTDSAAAAAEPVAEASAAVGEAEVVEEPVASVEAAVEEPVAAADAVSADAMSAVEVSADEPVAEEAPVAEEPATETPAAEEEEPVMPIDDLSQPLVPLTEDETEKDASGKPIVRIVSPSRRTDVKEDDETGDRRRRKGKSLVYDENAGRSVVKRKRKKSRRRPDWEDLGDFDDFG